MSRSLLGIILIRDILDNLLDDIFQRDAFGAAEFIDDNRNLVMVALHVLQERLDALGGRDVVRGPDERSDRRPGVDIQQFQGIDYPHDPVDALLIDRQPRLAGASPSGGALSIPSHGSMI
jgi:hypothetical protein